MRCDDIFDLMNRELDGDLAEEEQKQLQRHLVLCPDCAQLFEDFQAVSSQLAILPRIKPPYSIVDSILPALEELDQQNIQNTALAGAEQKSSTAEHPLETQAIQEKQKQSKGKKAWIKRNWWVPSSVVAAGLLAVYISSIGSESNQDLASHEMALFNESESTQYSSSNDRGEADATNFGITAHDQRKITGSIGEEPASLLEYNVFSSPDGIYEARSGEGHILINLSSGEEYYRSDIILEPPWEINSMEWVSNEAFYFELYEPRNEAYQYWMIDLKERSEKQLAEPYDFNSSTP